MEMPRRWHVAVSLSLPLSLCRPYFLREKSTSPAETCLVARLSLSLSLNLDIIIYIVIAHPITPYRPRI